MVSGFFSRHVSVAFRECVEGRDGRATVENDTQIATLARRKGPRVAPTLLESCHDFVFIVGC